MHMGNLLEPLLDTLCYVNRPYILKGNELQRVLEELRNVANNLSGSRYENGNNFTDQEFYSLSTRITIRNKKTLIDVSL